MRGLTTLRRRLALLRADERGSAIVYIAFASVVILGAASLVVDAGSGWLIRRSLVPAADSAALAAAQEFAYGYNGCYQWDDYYVWLNELSASVDGCLYSVGSDRKGWVSVTVTEDVDTSFADVLDQNGFAVEVVSTAMVGSPITVSDLRPLGLCYEGSAGLRDLMENPPSYQAVYLRIPYTREQPDACDLDATVGNWRPIDFDGGSTSAADVGALLTDGYQEQVAYDDDPFTDCGNEPACRPADLATDLGHTDVQLALDRLQMDGTWFTLPVFDRYDDAGSGDGSFRVMGVVRVKLLHHRLTGAESERFLDLYVAPGLVSGTCCGSTGEDSGNRVIALCGVEPGQFGGCTE